MANVMLGCCLNCYHKTKLPAIFIMKCTFEMKILGAENNKIIPMATIITISLHAVGYHVAEKKIKTSEP